MPYGHPAWIFSAEAKMSIIGFEFKPGLAN
jgi:hypothetical protein